MGTIVCVEIKNEYPYIEKYVFRSGMKDLKAFQFYISNVFRLRLLNHLFQILNADFCIP